MIDCALTIEAVAAAEHDFCLRVQFPDAVEGFSP
jgi:hypothetical protein